MSESAASHVRVANLLTYLAVCAAAIATMLVDGPSSRFWGGLGIALAVAFDLFDGRFARLFPRTEQEKQVGVEIDSLADVIAFGIAPAACLFKLAPLTGPLDRGVMLVAATFYCLCIVTRLAHFNVFQAGTAGFIGVPSNIGGLTCAVLLFWVPDVRVTAAVLVLVGAATVSSLRIPRPNRVVLYSILVIALAIAAGHLYRLMR